jgi:hypothetical protein
MLSANGTFLFGKENSQKISFITFIVTFILGIFELLAFAWIWHRNDRIYEQSIFSLSEKYQANKLLLILIKLIEFLFLQLSENIRTAKQLIPCIFLHFINIVFGTTQSILNTYKLIGTDQFYYDLVGGQLVFTTSSIISFFIELSMIMYNLIQNIFLN